MASAKKQEHLEAGKRKLEEFRKKKAAERAAKKSSNQPVDSQHEAVTDSNGPVISTGASETIFKPSQVVVNDENGATDFPHNRKVVSSDTKIAQAPIQSKEIDRFDGSSSSRIGSTNFSSSPFENNDDYGFRSNQSLAFSSQANDEDFQSSVQPSHGQSNKAYSKETDKQAKDLPFASSATSNYVDANVLRNSSGVDQVQKNPSYSSLLDTGLTLSSNEDSVKSSTLISASFPQVWQNSHDVKEPSNSSVANVGEKKLSEYLGNNSMIFWPTEAQSTASTTGLSSSSYSPLSETRNTRTRPSFLDSINLSRVEPEKSELLGSKVHETDAFSSNTEAPYRAGAFDHSTSSLVPIGNGNDIYKGATNNSGVERENLFKSRKQDEDFAALEQHIEDLTQEKFSLQRALEASRTLADSLAAENSSLTDSYNQQGSMVNQLKYDMEMLQEEIKAHQVELEAIKMEYGNAQLECTAADDRAKLLASEVINLEEKALRLRSNELKLDRQLENSQAELSSLKRKLSSLEKDRQDLQSTIDALQEEKKMLQAKLRKTSASGKSLDVGKSLDNKKNVSTSTEDLGHEGETYAAASISNLETDNDAIHMRETDSFPFSLPENGQFNLEFASSRIPSDQQRMIGNINTLISELALEKEDLMRQLIVQSSESSKMKDLNKELSRKLEIQTQRLELLTSQNMSNENLPIRQPDPRIMTMDDIQYADEGDEVVERVLGWIMKLFPGGPSRRRTSKLT